jgi:hypothetical protein
MRLLAVQHPPSVLMSNVELPHLLLLLHWYQLHHG